MKCLLLGLPLKFVVGDEGPVPNEHSRSETRECLCCSEALIVSREVCTEGLCSGSLNTEAPCRAVVFGADTVPHSVFMAMTMERESSSQVLSENL